MKRVWSLTVVVLLAGAVPLVAEGGKEKMVQFILPEKTAGNLQGKKVQVIEMSAEAGAAERLDQIMGPQGEPPIAAGKYFPQSVSIVLDDNGRIETVAYVSTSLPKGTKLTHIRRKGASFTAVSDKAMAQLVAFEGEIQR